tara:strand:- start:117 stop:761 length:645 start_codon:yes stop_codon:yes gene_type:complete
MVKFIDEIFNDKKLIKKIQIKLPIMFQEIEISCMRGGKIGMEVGKYRERPIIALLIYKFGKDAVEYEISDTEPETDVIVSSEKISLKSISNSSLAGIKVSWTVDWDSVKKFIENFSPSTHLIIIQILWNKKGKIIFIPNQVQKNVLSKIGREKFFKVPKQGTNPRGVEFSKNAIQEMILEPETKEIEIEWKRSLELKYNPYEEWVEKWKRSEFE